jgi:hypothetical protein
MIFGFGKYERFEFTIKNESIRTISVLYQPLKQQIVRLS